MRIPSYITVVLRGVSVNFGPRNFSMADIKKIHEWTGRVIKHHEYQIEKKNERKFEKEAKEANLTTFTAIVEQKYVKRFYIVAASKAAAHAALKDSTTIKRYQTIGVETKYGKVSKGEQQ